MRKTARTSGAPTTIVRTSDNALASRVFRCETKDVAILRRVSLARPGRTHVAPLVGGLVALLFASGAHAQTASTHPASDAYPPPSARWGLVGGGLGVTAAFYAIAQPFAYTSSNTPGVRDLRIPVAGPWIAIANNGCAPHDPYCSKFSVWFRGILTALDGIGQAGGLLIALEGAFLTTSSAPQSPVTQTPTQTPTRSPAPRNNTPSNEQDPQPPPRNLFFAPIPMGVGDSGMGISVTGVF